jgi:phosphoribulokinase
MPRRRTLRAHVAALIRRVRGDGWHWFDHPEMQARIEKAESDRREGRVERFESREAAFRHLDGIA